MSFFRSLSATLLATTLSFGLVTGSGCGTSAVGIDDCRDIEQARCRAGKACGVPGDVAACERYYRDHCLHGLATAPPPGASVSSCVQVIEAAGECAKSDPETRLEECDGAPQARSGLRQACDVILHPERATECSFLTNVPVVEGSGGESGSGSTDEPAAGGQAGRASDEAQGGSSE